MLKTYRFFQHSPITITLTDLLLTTSVVAVLCNLSMIIKVEMTDFSSTSRNWLWKSLRNSQNSQTLFNFLNVCKSNCKRTFSCITHICQHAVVKVSKLWVLLLLNMCMPACLMVSSCCCYMHCQKVAQVCWTRMTLESIFVCLPVT